MPRRRDERPRVLGPTHLKAQGYWRITIINPQARKETDRRITRYYREFDEADEAARRVAERFERNASVALGDGIDMYAQHLEDKGTIGYAETIRRLRLFFPDLEMRVRMVTAELAGRYYDVFRDRKLASGAVISVDYHRATLINARSFMKWCRKQGWIDLNPFAEVEGIGARSAGKEQHSGDETRVFYAYCLARAQEGDAAALGVLMALLMALRSSDLTRRVVRDVDLDGTVLRIGVGLSAKGKTQKSNRPRRIPEVLQPAVRQLAANRSPFEPLFALRVKGELRHHTRRWLEQAMERFCARAGVPYVCPHALKGTAGTLAAEMGDSADRIADHLSHEETGTTTRHYVAAGAVEEAQATRAFEVISGGRK